MEPTFKVPIRNVFCMLSYVNDMPEFINQMSDIDEDLISYDFLAQKFNEEVRKLLHRGLIKNYVEHPEETGFISGRLMINESIPLIVEKKPRMICEKDEYSANILFNQILKTTLRNLYLNVHINKRTRNESFLLWEKMPFINNCHLTRGVFNRLTFHRHNVHYKQSLHIAKLLYELQLLSHKSGDWSLYTIDINEEELNRLFEKFLFHFYRMELKQYEVKSERMSWSLRGENKSLLPTMLTDVSLLHKNRSEKIVMDAKFYRNMFQVSYGKNSFHSHNLYQLFTYLMHQPNELKRIRGILIYPFNGEEVHEIYSWDDRLKIKIATLNLNNKWKTIYDELINIIQDF